MKDSSNSVSNVQILQTKEDSHIYQFSTYLNTNFPKDFSYYTAQTQQYILQKEYNLHNLNRSIKSEHWNLLLAMKELTIIGYMLFTKPYGGVSSANWIAVNIHNRSQGIATQLLLIWQKRALKLGAHQLVLWTTLPYKQFYQNRDFTYVGSVPDAYFGIDNIIFHKHLRPSQEQNYLRGVTL